MYAQTQILSDGPRTPFPDYWFYLALVILEPFIVLLQTRPFSYGSTPLHLWGSIFFASGSFPLLSADVIRDYGPISSVGMLSCVPLLHFAGRECVPVRESSVTLGLYNKSDKICGGSIGNPRGRSELCQTSPCCPLIKDLMYWIALRSSILSSPVPTTFANCLIYEIFPFCLQSIFRLDVYEVHISPLLWMKEMDEVDPANT